MEKALQFEPTDIATLFTLGVTLESLGRWESAATFFEEILELDTDHTEAARRLGRIYGERLGDPDVAIVYWERVLHFNPERGTSLASIEMISCRWLKQTLDFLANRIVRVEPRSWRSWRPSDSSLIPAAVTFSALASWMA